MNNQLEKEIAKFNLSFQEMVPMITDSEFLGRVLPYLIYKNKINVGKRGNRSESRKNRAEKLEMKEVRIREWRC